MDSRSEKSNNKAEFCYPLVTIIVPVYQVYSYLNECVESLIHQTYTNLEIILVDDGSTDGSGALCDECARKDNRICVIHQENQGLSGARNTGLDYAAGEYVAFVDSDDFVMPVYIENLYKLLLKYHADIAACAYRKVNEKTLQSIVHRKKNGKNCRHDHSVTTMCMSSDKMLRQWHGRYKRYETVVWNKLYRTSILNGGTNIDKIRFPEGRNHEDVLTSHLIIGNVERVALMTQVLYLYRMRENSLTAGIANGKNIEQNLCAQRERMEFFRNKRYLRAYLNLWKGYVLHRVWFGWKRLFYKTRGI